MAKTKELNTPIGKFYKLSDNYYTGGDGQPWHFNYAAYDSPNEELGLYAGSYGNPSTPTYYAEALLPGYDKFGEYVPDFNKTVNTPLGNLNFESNYDIGNSVAANFTPNEKANYYIQALKNLLGR